MKQLFSAGLSAFTCVLSLGTYALAADQNADKGCICMELYQPVCASLPNGTKKNFSNSCFAKCEKATVIHAGRC